MAKQYHQPHLKMYILVRKRAPVGVAMVNACHAAMLTYVKYKNDPDTKKWLNPGPWYKVVVSVTDAQFKKAKKVAGHLVIREDRWHNAEVAMGFKPRLRWPKAFSEFPLFPDAKPKVKARKVVKRWKPATDVIGGDLRYITDPIEPRSHYADGM